MNLDESINQCIEILKSSSKIVLTTHINPDGDALGATLAMYHLALAYGFEAHIYIHSQVPAFLKFLPGSDKIKVFNSKVHLKHIYQADTILILDLNDSRRVGSLEDAILDSPARKVLIDHHLFPMNFADYLCVDTEASSTGEIVWRLIKRSGMELTKQMAENIYVAILTDTGSFRFSRTDAELHRIVAELIEAGADPVELYDKVYNQNSLHITKLLGLALSAMQLYHDGKLCVMTVTDEMFKIAGGSDDEIEGFVEKTLSIKGVQAGILMTEVVARSEARVSFRSCGDINVRALADQYNGGGHKNASGARISTDDFPALVTEMIEKAKMLF